MFIATLGMSGWLKWQIDGMNPWRAEKALWDFWLLSAADGNVVATVDTTKPSHPQ
ncbi:hypothetical protein HT118_10905 [Escherichia coli]|nr:hypothetical protein [Escherichia coli]